MHLLITKTTDENILAQCAALMYSSEPWLTLGRSYKNCLDAIHGDYKEVYVIMEHETLKAFAVLQLSGSFRGYIQSVCVAANARGQGIGTALLQFCEERIFKISPNVFMCVSSFNEAAARLYYTLGYEKIGEIKDFIIRGHDEILLRKTIGPSSEFVMTDNT